MSDNIVPDRKRGRPSKYKTDDERRIARNENRRNWYKRGSNKDKISQYNRQYYSKKVIDTPPQHAGSKHKHVRRSKHASKHGKRHSKHHIKHSKNSHSKRRSKHGNKGDHGKK